MTINPSSSKHCPKSDPDPRDNWRQYRYGEANGGSVVLLNRLHTGKANGDWVERWQPFSLGTGPNAAHGNAEVNSKKGVTLIYGSNLGKRDDNVANTVLDSFGKSTGSTYTFTRPPVPVEVLDNPDYIYKYERRRQTIVEGGVKMFELFKPNSHFAPHRYYLDDGMMLRHEQVANDGLVTRVITVGNYAQPRPGASPAVNDKLLSDKGRFMHQVFHRVYEVDQSKKPKLIAMSWNRARRLSSRDDVAIGFAHLVYGTADGVERWKTKAEFEKAFNTSSRASHVFPDITSATQFEDDDD